MKTLNWNEMSELGLIDHINKEVLHPIGLAISRNPKTGSSDFVLVADDGVFEYPGDMENGVLSDCEFKAKLSEIIKAKA